MREVSMLDILSLYKVVDGKNEPACGSPTS